jgi:hypothetical protein
MTMIYLEISLDITLDIRLCKKVKRLFKSTRAQRWINLNDIVTDSTSKIWPVFGADSIRRKQKIANRPKHAFVKEVFGEPKTFGEKSFTFIFRLCLQSVSLKVRKVSVCIRVAQIIYFQKIRKKLNTLLYYYLQVSCVEQSLFSLHLVQLYILYDCPF